jgi:hypothetical protein
MVKEDYNNYMKIYITEKEMQYEKLLNEIYMKTVGLKNYTDIDNLLSDWQKIEDEYYNRTDPAILKRVEVLYRIKSLRFKENLKKLIKNIKLNEDVF